MCVGLSGACSFAVGCGHTIRSIPVVANPIRTEAPRQSLQGQENLHEPTEPRECPGRLQGGRILGIGCDFYSGRQSERETVVRRPRSLRQGTRKGLREIREQ